MNFLPGKTLLLVLLFLLAGCASEQRYVAPVSDKTGYSPAGGDKWVTVKKGDTLFSISFAHGRSHQSVAEMNGIRPPYTIYPGQRIKVTGISPVQRKSSATSSKRKSTSTKKSTTTTRKSTITRKPRVANTRVNWTWPVNGKIIRSYSSKAPRKKGIGITARAGETIKAAAGGKVVYSGDGLLGYGNLIIVKHDENYLSAYAHNRNVYVKEGQAVKRGQKIASMGNNENGTPMLHFEVRKHGKPVNPLSYLPRR